jgi:hypothetical protein
VSESDITLKSGRADWLGGELPYAIPSKKLGMWLFIVSDSITFGAVLVCYAYLRLASPNWPTPFRLSSIVNGAVMTFVLLSSSVTMVAAVEAAKHGRIAASVRWLSATMLGGIMFRHSAHPRVARLDSRGPALVFKPLGFIAVWGGIFYADRPAHDPRHRWRHLSGYRGHWVSPGQIHIRRRGN